MPCDDGRGLELAELVYIVAVCLGARAWPQVFAKPTRDVRQGLLVRDPSFTSPRLVRRRWRGDIAAISLAVEAGDDVTADHLTVARVFEVPVRTLLCDDGWSTKPLLHLGTPRGRVCLDNHNPGCMSGCDADVVVAVSILYPHGYFREVHGRRIKATSDGGHLTGERECWVAGLGQVWCCPESGLCFFCHAVSSCCL